MNRQVVRGGTLVDHRAERRADLVIEDGAVIHVGDVTSHQGDVIDATGMLVLPGMVDTHVHLMDPGSTDREDFPTGTNAAAARGVTTIIEHTHAHAIRTLGDFADKLAYLKGRANVDFGLAAHVWPESIPGLPELAEAGVSFFKIFTCHTHGVPGLDSRDLSAALERIGGVGARALIHNEDQELTAAAERRLKAEGRVDPALLIEWRSREAETVAVASTAALVLNSGARVSFAHVSNTDALDVLDSYRNLGATIAAEACPQYFTLQENELESMGALRKFTPPARIRSEQDRVSMWQAVTDSRFAFFSTDHAPSTIVQKTGVEFWDAPFGLPGLDTTLPFLIDAAIRGKLTVPDVVRLYSTAPAEWYGLPKGRLTPGSDADFVLVDPTSEWVVADSDIISKAGWSPYSGRTFKGRIVATYLRGTEISMDGVPHDLRSGSFVAPVAQRRRQT